MRGYHTTVETAAPQHIFRGKNPPSPRSKHPAAGRAALFLKNSKPIYILKIAFSGRVPILGNGVQKALFRFLKPVFYSEKTLLGSALHSENKGRQSPELHFFVFIHYDFCYYAPQRWNSKGVSA